MDFIFLFCTIFLGLNVQFTASKATCGSNWQSPYFEVVADPKISKISDQDCEVHFNFQEEVVDFKIGTFPGNVRPVLFSGTEYFEVKTEDSKFILYAKAPIDYDIEGNELVKFRIGIADEYVQFFFHIININDKPVKIILSDESCEVPESLEQEVIGKTPCSYTIMDEDGIDKTLDISLISAHTDFFEFIWDGVIGDHIGKKTATATLHTKKPLDYEQNQMFVFDWTIEDDEDKATAKIIVNVKDIPNQPPKWIKIFSQKQFIEKSPQKFEVSAVDGDYGVDYDISFTCPIDDMSKELKDTLTCGPGEERNTGIINILPIDRDKDDISTLKFIINACEPKLPELPEVCTPQDIVLMIDDLNDHEPEINPSVTKIKFEEQKFINLKELIEITINDKDSGENAQYDVTLFNPDFDVTKIFQTIPNKGYQETSFQLTIIDASFLDFDRTDIDMTKFKLTITATELDPSKEPQKKDIEIELINWNDEVPKFTQTSVYEVEIEETFGRCKAEELKITNLYATDLDVGDRVSYTLLGTDINRRLTVSGENEDLVLKTIYKNAKENCDIQVFDFEKLGPEISFQIQASDNFPDSPITNKAYGEVTIKIIDVNDETPHIEVSPAYIELGENQDDGKQLMVTITGTDPDTQSILKFDIDWEKSYATKSGQRNDTLFKTYEGCFRLEPKGIDNAELFIVDKDPNIDNTPDYEKFDTINLNIFVEDTDQTIEGVSNRADAMLIINVKDINDNPPVFNKEMIERPKKIKENSEKGTPIVPPQVTATDADVGTELTYSLKARNGTEKLESQLGHLLSIDGEGQISVYENRAIDAENNGNDGNDRMLYELYYDVCATDGKFPKCEEISIVVEDVNDVKPSFKKPPEDITDLKENSEVGHPVYQVKAYDGDRDKPNNVVMYKITSTPENNFLIDQKTGEITVKNEELNREEIAVYEITVTIVDTPDFNNEPLSSEAKFKIKLKDENDNCPVFKKGNMPISENTEAGMEVGTFTVTDDDEPGNKNSEIEMKLMKVYSEGTGDRILKQEDFDLEVEQVDQENKGMATGKIITKKSLRKYYGTHKLLIQAKDKGPENEGLPCDHTVLENVTLIIGKYSFSGPTFKYPREKPIYLKHDQEVNTALKDQGGNNLPKIEAYDPDVEDKYNIKFSISDKNKGSTYFEIVDTIEQNKGVLQYKMKPDDEGQQYEIEIIATNDDQRPLSTTKIVKIGFYDQEAEPIFKEKEINLNFKEDKEGVGNPQVTSEAIFEGPEGSEYPIYYLLQQNIHDAFECNIDNGEITLMTPLYMENTTENHLLLRASSTEQGVGTPNPRSLLKINIELIDVNNHAPEFDQDEYAFGIINEKTKTPYVINGSDLDTLDKLTYYMKEGTFKAEGEGLTAELTFDIKTDANRRCQIVQNFEVQANMEGYFLFDLIVDDSKHTAEAHVKVYIISELHLADIRFENTLSEVENNKEEIGRILSEVLGYTCVVHKCEKASENGVDVDNKSKAITYCIDPKLNMPVNKDDINTAMKNIETFKKLTKAFGLVGNGLSLKEVNIPVVPENIESVLWAWLISVSVVLGTLCLLLIAAFILKNRSWTKRLNKLSTVKFHSQESNLNVAAPPTTNRRAVEGSNPIFNTSSYDDEKHISSFDTESISSGESDLVGVENNPAFTMEKFS